MMTSFNPANPNSRFTADPISSEALDIGYKNAMTICGKTFGLKNNDEVEFLKVIDEIFDQSAVDKIFIHACFNENEGAYILMHKVTQKALMDGAKATFPRNGANILKAILRLMTGEQVDDLREHAISVGKRMRGLFPDSLSREELESIYMKRQNEKVTTEKALPTTEE